jgi:hypothetical protein
MRMATSNIHKIRILKAQRAALIGMLLACLFALIFN